MGPEDRPGGLASAALKPKFECIDNDDDESEGEREKYFRRVIPLYEATHLAVSTPGPLLLR